jgi:drug/metabolite transporter (DMT)-like permease
MLYAGELAALTTAMLWSFTSIFFTSAGRRIGSYHLNKFRIPFASVFLAIMLLVTSGRLFPEGASSDSYYYLILSGIIGLSIGDLCLFTAFVMIGTRLTLLIFAVSPIIAALIAWIMLAEKLGLVAIGGIVITIAGIGWVTAERQTDATGQRRNVRKWQGILLAVCAAIGQAAGLVLAKAGMGETVSPLQATFIRMIAAAAAVWLFGLLKGDNAETISKIKDRRSMWLALGGAVCGPFLGVWLSLVAVKYTETGIAAAIMATVPVLVIPLVIIFYHEKVSLRAIIGAIITASGVALFFIR